MLHWSFFLAMLGTVAHQSSATNLRTMCKGHPSGTLLPNPQDCNSYYVCQSGPQLAYCDYGLHFDRIHKVCNWPDWANCKLEDVDNDNLIAEQGHMELPEEKFKEPLEPEISEDKRKEDLEEPVQTDSVEEQKPDENVDEIAEKPPHIQLSKEPNVIHPETDKTESHGVGSFVASSLSKDPSSEDKVAVKEEIPKPIIEITGLKPENDQLLTVHVPDAAVPVQTSNNTKNSTYVIKVPVVVPAQNADFGSKPSLKPTHVIEVPVVAPAEIPNSAGSSKNSTLVVKVPVVVPTEIPNSPLGDLAAEIIDGKEVPPNNQTQDIQQIPEAVEIVENSKPSKGQDQVIELPSPVLPVQVLTPTVDSSISAAEKVDSSKPSQATNQVIELLVPSLPEEVANALNAVPEAESPLIPVEVLTPNAVEKVDSSKPSNQVIELLVPALPAEVLNSVDYALNAMPQAEIVVEKVEPEKSTQNSNSNQVIELPVPSHPIVIPNANVEISSPSQAQVVIEKVEKPTDSKHISNPVQIIELPVYAGPVSSEEDTVNVKVKQELDSESSEEDHIHEVEKVVISDSKDQASLDSDEFAEENLVQSLHKSIESFEAPIDSEDDKGFSESSEENVKKPGQSQVDAQEHNLSSDSMESSEENPAQSSEITVSKVSPESSEENVLKPTHHHHPDEFIAQKVEASESQSSEEDTVKPHHHHYHAHQTNEASVDLQSSEENQASSVEGLLLVHHHHHHHSNTNRVDKPTNTESGKDSSVETDDDIIHHLPTPHANKPVDSPVPIGKPIAPQQGADARKHHTNLIVSILSVASIQSNGSANGTINRPIVGAHNTETGHPIDMMTGYSSNNVQCIHNGLYFLPHPSSCQKYFICAYHHLHLHSCGNNLIWNYKREQCELRSDSRCYSKEAAVEVSPEPEKPSNPSGENSSVEIIPVREEAAEEVSPKPEESSNPSRENSSEEIIPVTEEAAVEVSPKPEEPSNPSKENSSAEIVPVTEVATESTPMPPLRTTQATEVSVSRDSMLPKCPEVRQTYLPSLDDCNKYYICILGQAVLTSCPDNLYWDARGEFCGQPTEAICAGR